MLAYLSAGLPVEALLKHAFGFLLLLFIRFDFRLSVRFTWGLAVQFNYVYTRLI
jgi:hypothetical protein